MLSSIVNKRLSEYFEDDGLLGDEQGGLRSGRGCIDQEFSLHSIVGERIGIGSTTYLCFIDIKNAYDRVWRDGRWWTIAENGVKGKIWRTLRACIRQPSLKSFVEAKTLKL